MYFGAVLVRGATPREPHRDAPVAVLADKSAAHQA